LLKKLLNSLILIPVIFIAVALGVANRHLVKLVLDPISPEAPIAALEAPFFVYLFAALALGVVLGGIATWFSQRKWRKAARQRSLEAIEWRREAERLGREMAAGRETATQIDGRQQAALPSA
jgi:uncharacterized membrane protein YciS (DUF1049 family)